MFIYEEWITKVKALMGDLLMLCNEAGHVFSKAPTVIG